MSTLSDVGTKVGSEFKADRVRITTVENDKVDKVVGKQLSTEDYSTAEKSKLAGIEDGAEVNVVTSVASKVGDVTLDKTDVGLNNVDNTADINKDVLSATKLSTSRNIELSGGVSGTVAFDGSSDVNVVTTVDSVDASAITSGTINADRLPSYVDDVLEYADLATFPVVGETGKIYIALDTNKAYRWSGSVYIYITSGAVDSVNGHTGIVVLDKSDVGLSNVDNTSDANKPVSTATQTALNGKADVATTLAGYGIADAYTKTEAQTILPKVGFDTTNVTVPGVGQMAWNQDEGTVDLGLMDAVLQVGQEFLVKVRNASGGVITNGTVVMASGSIGNSSRITVVPHDGTQVNAARVIGVLTQILADGADGFATILGKVRDINTTGSSVSETWLDGEVLYIKPNDNGNLTKVTPIDTEISMKVATVVKAHTSGTLYVRVNGFDENHYKAWVQTRLDTKVDKVAGKGLSTEDYTTAEKSKLAGIDAYTKSESDTKYVARPISTLHRLAKFTDTAGSIGDSNLISNSGGDLGLNVSPSLWHGNVRALETAAGSVFNNLTTTFGMAQNAYYSVGGYYERKGTGLASLYTQEAGEHKWFSAVSAAAGTSVTFNEVMKVSSAGVLTVSGATIPTMTDFNSTHIFRADKYLAAQDIANMLYDGSNNLVKIRYNVDADTDYEVLAYTGGNLSTISHYTGGVLRGTTTLSYTSGSLVSAIFA